MLLNFIGAKDLVTLCTSGEGSAEKTVRFVQWSSLSLFFLLIPTLLAFGFSAFSDRKTLKICALVLGAAVVACIVVFMVVPANFPHYGNEDKIDQAALSVLTEFRGTLVKVSVPMLFFTAASAIGVFRPKKKTLKEGTAQ